MGLTIQPSQIKNLSDSQLAELAKKYSIDPKAQPKSELTDKILNSIMTSINGAKEKASAKEAAYLADSKQYNIFSATKTSAEAKLNAAQANSLNGNSSNLDEAKDEYAKASHDATNWRIESEVALGSWQNANEYAGKLGNYGIIASSIFS